MKLYKNKNVVAILSAITLLSTPVISNALDHNLDAFYDDTSINIENKQSFTLRINKQKLEELINLNEKDIITVQIENNEVNISREELIRLKNKADDYEKEKREYTIIISLIGTLTVATILLKEKAKEKLHH